MASAGRDRILAVSMDICSANIQALPSILVPWLSLSFVVAPQQSFDAATADDDDDTVVLSSCPAWALRMSAATVADTSLRVVVVVVFVRFWSDMDAHDKCRAAAVMFAAVPFDPELNFDDDDDAAADDDDAVVPFCPAWALRIAPAAAFVADTSLRVVVVVVLLLLFVWFWSDMDAHNGKCRAAAVMCAAPLELEITTVLAFACKGQASWLSFWSVLLFRADAPRLDARWSWSDPAALATATAPVPTTTAADSFAPLLLVERTEEPTIAAAAVVAAAPRLCEPWSIWAVVFDSETKFVVVVVVAAAVVVLVVVEMPF
jgi:hypothetical protein